VNTEVNKAVAAIFPIETATMEETTVSDF